jgi:hypothetical protein
MKQDNNNKDTPQKNKERQVCELQARAMNYRGERRQDKDIDKAMSIKC